MPPRPGSRPRPFRGSLFVQSDLVVPRTMPFDAHAAWMAGLLAAHRDGLLRFAAVAGNRGNVLIFVQTFEDGFAGTVPAALLDALHGTGLALDLKLEFYGVEGDS